MTNKVKFTKTKIKSFKVPDKGKRAYFYDTVTPSLVIQITAKGTKTFQVYKWMDNKAIRVTLGKYPELTIEQARKQAFKKLAELADGINPNQKKKADKVKGITLLECFNDYIEQKNGKLKPGTVHDYKRVLNEGFKDWHTRPLKDITRDLVASKHRKLGESSQARANNAMRVLRALFNFAAEVYEDEEGRSLFPDNPVKRLSKTTAWFNVGRKQTIIKEHELEAWFKSVQTLVSAVEIGDSNDKLTMARDYLLTLMLTGMRKTECAKLLWDNVDFNQKTLKIVDTKNSKPHILPLSDYLFDVLKDRHCQRNQDIFVFPNNQTNTGYISEPRRAIALVREQSGVMFTLHDLRRTFITIAEGCDTSVYALKRLVNHSTKNNDVTDGYIITDVDRLRKPMQKITDYILKIAKIKSSSATVIQLKKLKA